MRTTYSHRVTAKSDICYTAHTPRVNAKELKFNTQKTLVYSSVISVWPLHSDCITLFVVMSVQNYPVQISDLWQQMDRNRISGTSLALWHFRKVSSFKKILLLLLLLL